MSIFDSVAKLEADAIASEVPIGAAVASLKILFADLEAIAADLGVTIPQLFSESGVMGSSPEKESIKARIVGAFDGHRLKAAYCLALPWINMLLVIEKLPPQPTPDFCLVPTPPPAP